MKKKMIIALVLVSLFTASCSRYVVDRSAGGGCGVWYPKKCKIGTKNW